MFFEFDEQSGQLMNREGWSEDVSQERQRLSFPRTADCFLKPVDSPWESGKHVSDLVYKVEEAVLLH